MLDCKAMATPMDTNMKLLSNETSELSVYDSVQMD